MLGPRDPIAFFQELVLLAPAILFAVTCHEVAHGWVADRLGDPTARLAGRLTLNPLPHIDPIGALMFVIARFGWAKPVPVNPLNLPHPVRDMIWVAAAGPAANLVVAAASLVVAAWVGQLGVPAVSTPLRELFRLSFVINVNLAAFNLIPIPPLDGSQILKGLLPRRERLAWQRLEPYGFLILVAFLLTGLAGAVLLPLSRLLMRGLFWTLQPLLQG